MSVLIVDNYDSFVYNLSQALSSLGARTAVVRNDAWTMEQVRAFAPDALVISPGPGHPGDPARFGICAEIIRTLGDKIPILGVCLGHQGIVETLGGSIIRAPQVMHGKCSEILHDGRGLFEGLPQRFAAMRYHSLIADPARLPDCLTVRAWTSDGTIMAVEHRSAPMCGVQFHPESIGTPLGRTLLANFLQRARDFQATASSG